MYLIFPVIKREGEKLIMLPSPREREEKSLQEQRLRPPAIKSSYFKAKGLKKKKRQQSQEHSELRLHKAREADQYSGKN